MLAGALDCDAAVMEQDSAVSAIPDLPKAHNAFHVEGCAARETAGSVGPGAMLDSLAATLRTHIVDDAVYALLAHHAPYPRSPKVASGAEHPHWDHDPICGHAPGRGGGQEDRAEDGNREQSPG